MELVAITLDDRSLRLVRLPDGGIDLRADEGPPGPDSVFQRLDLSHGRVALRVPDGRYLARHIEHPGSPTDQGATVHLVDEVTQCAAFEELSLTGGYLSLRACDLRFLGVHASGRVVADRIANGSWERFRYLEIPAALGSVPERLHSGQPGSAPWTSGQSSPPLATPVQTVQSTSLQSTSVHSTPAQPSPGRSTSMHSAAFRPTTGSAVPGSFASAVGVSGGCDRSVRVASVATL